jgi:uncharacterized protein (DUF305 family)
MRSLHVLVAALVVLATPASQAQNNPHHHPIEALPAGAAPGAKPVVHSAHNHDVGPAGRTYDLRWLDAMVQHHIGALRMSEYVFDIGVPGVGALAKEIWRDQAQEIKAMGQWRRAWYPEAPVYPVVLIAGGDPNALADLTPMGAARMQAMRMMVSTPTRDNRVIWFLEGMLHHHGGALSMAHDALRNSRNPTLLRLARNIILKQRVEIIQIRRMLQHNGLHKPEYFHYDKLFFLR